MEERLHAVAIGEMVVSDDPRDVLVAYGLGSCVVVCLYDTSAHVGGMLHALLPLARDPARAARAPARFVDQGVPLLLEAVLDRGARRLRLQASLCGGARIVIGPVSDGQLSVGRHNVQTAAAVLESLRIPIQARDTGGTHGRTVRLYLADGTIVVRTMRGEKALP